MAGMIDQSISMDKKEDGFFNEFFKHFGLEKQFQIAKLYVDDHPVVSLFFLIVTVMCTGPIICFVFFVVGSITVTFFGFLFVEGAFLIIAIMVLGGVLVFMGLTAVGIFISLVLFIYINKITEDLLQKTTKTFMRYLPSIISSKQEMVAKAE